MLDLVRLSPRRLFPPGGVELYRQIALLTGMSEAHEVLDVASGKGVPSEYFVREFGATASGVDIDATMIETAELWSREHGMNDRLQFQSGRSDALPYRDEVFDVTIGEIGLANHCDPADAVRELVRVTKPGGFVVLVQLVWKAPVDEARRAVLSEHLGARPLMVVEWKRLLRESGVDDLHVEDWSDDDTAFRPAAVKPFPDFAELFTLSERLAILRRAWKRWGWRGVRAAVARESEVHKLLTNERILGLDLLRGRKAPTVEKQDPPERSGSPEPEEVESTEGVEGTEEVESAEQQPVSVSAATHRRPTDGSEDDSERGQNADTSGLPLFGDRPGALDPIE